MQLRQSCRWAKASQYNRLRLISFKDLTGSHFNTESYVFPTSLSSEERNKLDEKYKHKTLFGISIS